MATILEQITEELAGLKATIADLELQQSSLNDLLFELEEKAHQLEIAHGALTGKPYVSPAPYVPPVPSPAAYVQPPQIVHRNGPTCNSCGGEMHPVERTLQSGRTVNLLACSDCSNERL